jgi:S1-C subfamily serine protease
MTEIVGTQLLQSFSNAVTELAENVGQSVVTVNSERSGGTGIVWSDEGLIVTANHVVGHSDSPRVMLGDGRQLAAKVLGRDVYTDVALLKIDAKGLRAIETGVSGDVKVGQFVLALASAFGRKASATSGIITSHGKRTRGFWGMMIEDPVVSDARLNPGYSGGPLVDARGKLIGMNVAYYASRGIAVSVDSLKKTADSLARDGRVKKGFLGVVVEPIELPPDLAKNSEVGQSEGLLVRGVEAGTPARAAGLVIGDIILKLDEAEASDEYELHKALSSEVVGKPVKLRVLRAEKVVGLTVTPREAEA